MLITQTVSNLAELISPSITKPLVLVGAGAFASDAGASPLTSAINAFKAGTGKFAVTLPRRVAGNIIKLGEKVLFHAPAANSKTLIEATQWYREQLPVFKNSDWINPNLPMQAQAEQAMRIQSLLLQSMKQSLYGDGKATYAEFMNALKDAGIEIPKYLSIKAARAEIKMTGEPLFQALRDKYMKIDLPTLRYEPACFAGGTLVHTKEGLKPIETIQVGDWVLSKHESGEGEREYKRVTQTFKHEDREVMMITIGGLQEDGERRSHRFIVTPEHPIWVQGKGWKPAGKLKWTVPFWDVEWLISDESYVDSTPRRLLVTGQKNVAWFPGSAARSSLNYRGGHINVNTLEIINGDASIGIESIQKTNRIKSEHLFHTKVYNLEVEDFHTYYVGESGLWVHNKLSTVNTQIKVGEQILPNPGGYILPIDHNVPVYLSKAEVYGVLNKEGEEIGSGIFLSPAKSDSK